MVELDTKRLRIFPITPEQSRLWLEDLPALERQLGCPYRGEPLGEAELRAARRQMDAAREDLVRYPYRTAWFLVHREEKAVIGTAGFLGPPDRRGELEIRYAMGSAYRGRGYMTEAVEAICRWALGQPGVRHITAETDLMGRASQRVLEHLGFQKYREEETLWWRL